MKHLKEFNSYQEKLVFDPGSKFLFFSKWEDFADWITANPEIEKVAESLMGMKALIPSNKFTNEQNKKWLWDHYYGSNNIMLICIPQGEPMNFISARLDVNSADYDEKYNLPSARIIDLYGIIHSYEFFQKTIKESVKQIMGDNPRLYINNAPRLERLMKTLYENLPTDEFGVSFNWEALLLEYALKMGYSEGDFVRKLKVVKILRRA